MNKSIILIAMLSSFLIGCGSGSVSEDKTTIETPVDWFSIVGAAQRYELGQNASWGQASWNGSYWQIFASWTTGSGTSADPYVPHSGTAVSSDGINWTFASIPSGGYERAIWVNGKWWTSCHYTIQNSTDGLIWTIVTNPTSQRYQSLLPLVWTGNYFITFEMYGTYYYTSEDGITWLRRTLPITGYWWQQLIWNGSILLAMPGIGGQGANLTNMVSSDGVNWTLGNIGNMTELATNIWTVAWNGSVFFLSGGFPSGTGRTATSVDGITWTYRNIPGVPSNITTIGNTFMGVSQSSFATSQDGITWTIQLLPFINRTGIATNGQYLLITGSNTPYVYKSPNYR